MTGCADAPGPPPGDDHPAGIGELAGVHQLAGLGDREGQGARLAPDREGERLGKVGRGLPVRAGLERRGAGSALADELDRHAGVGGQGAQRGRPCPGARHRPTGDRGDDVAAPQAGLGDRALDADGRHELSVDRRARLAAEGAPQGHGVGVEEGARGGELEPEGRPEGRGRTPLVVGGLHPDPVRPREHLEACAVGGLDAQVGASGRTRGRIGDRLHDLAAGPCDHLDRQLGRRREPNADEEAGVALLGGDGPGQAQRVDRRRGRGRGRRARRGRGGGRGGRGEGRAEGADRRGREGRRCRGTQHAGTLAAGCRTPGAGWFPRGGGPE